MRRRKEPNYPNLALAIVCILILFIVIISPPRCQTKYKMELYVRTPENQELKIRECEGLNPEMNCGINYRSYLCTGDGVYYGKAVTYLNDKILSSSGWAVLPDLCRH